MLIFEKTSVGDIPLRSILPGLRVTAGMIFDQDKFAGGTGGSMHSLAFRYSDEKNMPVGYVITDFSARRSEFDFLSLIVGKSQSRTKAGIAVQPAIFQKMTEVMRTVEMHQLLYQLTGFPYRGKLNITKIKDTMPIKDGREKPSPDDFFYRWETPE